MLSLRVLFILTTIVLAGCEVGLADAVFDRPDDEEQDDDDDIDPSGAFGVITGPRHGDLLAGDTTRTQIALSGYHEQPGYEIELQVLEDPRDLTSWITMAVATTGDELAAEAAGEDLYRWSAALDPIADGDATRWPQGGILRVRAVGAGGEILTRLYAGSACGQGEPIRDVASACGDAPETGLILVSPVADLADVPIERPGFLLDKGVGSPEETDEYYAEINAPATADEFRARFGFDAETDVVATYFNLGDLATGREVRCRPFTEDGNDGVACLTGNYGFFSGDRNLALAQAIEGTESGVSAGAFALVAMVYIAPITAPNSVQFMVYGAGGQLVNEAELDTHGDNPSIPQNCINCHGSHATYDPGTNQVIDARFLPFDVDAFAFAAEDGYTLADQSEPIRELNRIVYDAGLSIGSRELIDGWYGEGLEVAGTAADTDFVPPGWSESLRSIETYNQVVAPYCRGCHASRELGGAREPLDFTSLEQMRPLAALIGGTVCGLPGDASTHRMPSAQVVAREFWRGAARAYLLDLFDIPGSCAP